MCQAIIVFGITGDLSRKKLLPALSNVVKQTGVVCDDFSLIGVATRKLDKEKMFQYCGLADNLKPLTEYISGDFSQIETFTKIKEVLKDKIDVVFYLATLPHLYQNIVNNIGLSGLNIDQSRIIIEKPFGFDLASAGILHDTLAKYFKEDQIYRIDHYLGKETVQNLSVFRFANGMFEPLWNRQYIEYVTVTVAESEGVVKRGKYFDKAGTLKDVIQNHLLQILAMIAMEPPINFEAKYVRDEKVKLLKCIRKIEPKDVVRGQYIGYRNEENVEADSKTETFCAMKFFIDNWRWADIPFYIRSGKALKERKTEVVISFRQPPLRMFKSFEGICGMPNRIIFTLQPEKSISIKFGAKKPGAGMDMMPVSMDFDYSQHDKDNNLSEYERLIIDAVNRDLSLFARNDNVFACWEVIENILKNWLEDKDPLCFYEPASWGPKEVANLFENHCQRW